MLIRFDVLTHGSKNAPLTTKYQFGPDRRDRRRGPAALPELTLPRTSHVPARQTHQHAGDHQCGRNHRPHRPHGRRPGRPLDDLAGRLRRATTRTNDTEGTVTAAGHNISTGNTVAVFWTGGSRDGCTAGTVSGSAVPITGGEGDNLPTQATAVTICKATTTTVLVFAGSALKDPGHHLRQAGALRPDRRHHGQPLGLRDPGRRRRLFLVGRRPGRRALQRHRRHGQRLQRRHHGRHADDHPAVDVSKCCAS